MKILVIGCGGREHAIIKNLVKNNEVYCVGEWLNPGITVIVKTYYVIEGLNKKQFQNVLNQIKPNMTFIGPEKYLVEGIVVAIAAWVMPGKKSDPVDVICLGLVAAATFSGPRLDPSRRVPRCTPS